MTETGARRRPTVHDVAREAGVSIATVSTTFTRPEKVRPSTQHEVREAAARIGYVPNAAARSLVQGRTRVFGLMSSTYLYDEAGGDAPLSLVSDPSEVPIERGADLAHSRSWTGFVEDVRRGVELGCMDLGYGLLLGAARRDSAQHGLRELLSRIDGLIVLPWAEPADLGLLRTRRVPIVALSFEDPEVADDTVVTDNEMAMRALVRHLVEEHGRRRLLFVGHFDGYDTQARMRGVAAEVAERSLAPIPPLRTRGPRLEDGELEAHLDSLPTAPDAILCASDHFAEQVIRLLPRRGQRVPQDVSVTGFDASIQGAFLDPPLTSVRADLERMGRTAVRLLDERYRDSTLPPRLERVPVAVYLRRSCGCV